MRKRHKIKQKVLAKKLGMSWTALSAIENGHIILGSVAPFLLISGFFRVSLDWLITGVEHNMAREAIKREEGVKQ